MHGMTLERDSIEDNCRARWDHLLHCSFFVDHSWYLVHSLDHDTITQQSMAVSLLMTACRNMLENV